MRLFYSVFLCLCLTFPMQAQVKVATTFTIIADIAANVVGQAGEVISITRPGADVHNYQPTPRDILRARDADLILWNGLGMELWFERFFRNLGDVPSVVVSEGVEPISISSGPYDGQANPHAWMSPTAVLTYVANIRDALIEIDPDNADIYTQNAQAYAARIAAVEQEIRAVLQTLPAEQRWLATSEGAFSYLARDFDLRELYIWPINADAQGTPQQMRAVIDTVRAEGISVIFSESTISPDAAEQIARETGARYGGILYVDSLSDEEGPVPTYLDLLRVTAGRIAQELTQ